MKMDMGKIVILKTFSEYKEAKKLSCENKKLKEYRNQVEKTTTIKQKDHRKR